MIVYYYNYYHYNYYYCHHTSDTLADTAKAFATDVFLSSCERDYRQVYKVRLHYHVLSMYSFLDIKFCLFIIILSL